MHIMLFHVAIEKYDRSDLNIVYILKSFTSLIIAVIISTTRSK